MDLMLLTCSDSLLSRSHTLFAYIDPGSGSILLQLMIGAVVGAGLFLRQSIVQNYYKFTGLFRSRTGKTPQDAKAD